MQISKIQLLNREYINERWWIVKKLYGKQLKKLINDNISDNDIVCFGEKGDDLGRYDRQILGVERRKIGFDDEFNGDTYKAIIIEPFESNGAMKFWK